MKVLILTGRFGMGHVRCAETVSERITENDPSAEVQIVDMIDYLLSSFKKIVYGFFKLEITKFSRLYNYLTRVAGSNGEVPFKKIISGRILKLMNALRPDLVIATFPLCGMYFSAYKEITGDRTPLFIYITDITSHREWIVSEADMYFVADETTREILLTEGVPPENVQVTGIPVSRSFTYEASPHSKRKRILVTGGGIGLIPNSRNLLSTLNDMDNADVTLVCGNNAHLFRTSTEKYRNIRTIGFTDNMPDIMKSSDVIITKPGGITIFEAISSQTPLMIIKPDLEQEMENARYVEQNRLGVILDSEKSLPSHLNDDRLLDEIRENMQKKSETFRDDNPLKYFYEAGYHEK